MAGPLAGIRVLDLTTVVMGPFATQILAELGADVIKVESPEGDAMRHVGPMKSKGMGHLFMHLNRGKRGVVLDLKQPAGRDAALRLAARADVLVYNVRPAAMARLGLGYDAVREVNPRLIYVGAYGYSQRGRNAGKAAYDDLIQGATGLPWLVSRGGSERPQYVPVNMADRVTGLHVVYAVTAALFHRERTGEGQAVEVPMYESVAQFVLGDHLAGRSYVPPIGETGYARLQARRVYRTQDGWLCALVYNDKHWRGFLPAVGRAELLEDERFRTHTNRAANIDALYDLLEEIFQTRTSAEWVELLDRLDIPVGPMHSVGDMLDDPHLEDSEFFATEQHPTEGTVLAPRTPTGWSASAPAAPAPAPPLGAHSRAVLSELGYSEADIDTMIASGATAVTRTP